MALTQISQAGAKDEAINEAKIQISNAGTNGQFLQKQSGNTGGLTWADVPAGVGGGNGADFNDNVKIRLGTGNDLEIYHDGSNSYVRESSGSSTGDLLIQGNNIKLRNWDGGQTYLHGSSSGSVDLYHDGNKKLETNSTGVHVTGMVTCTTEFRCDDNEKFIAGTHQDLQIYHDGSNSYIHDAGTGQLRISSDNFKVYNQAQNETIINAVENGAVSLYYDNSKKFETYASGIKSTGHILPAADNTYNLGAAGAAWAQINVGDHGELRFGNGQDFKIRHDGTDNHIASANGDININVADTETAAIFKPNNAVELYYDNSKKFETTSNGAGLLSNSSVFKLGGSSPAELFHNGVNFHLKNPVGTLHLQLNNDENAIRCFQNGAVELNHDNVKSLETTATGCTILKAASNQNAELFIKSTNGGQAKLQLEAGGNQGGGVSRAARIDFVNTEVGTTPIWTLINDYDQNGTNDFRVAHGAEVALAADPDGAVELFYDGSKKAATASDGFTLWGNLNPYGNNAINIGANNARVSKVYSDYLIHRHGQSGGVGQNESEAIYYRAGIHIFGDYVTMSNSNFTNGICGNRSYPLLAVHQNGSGAAIHAEDGAITEASDYRIKENVNALGSGIDKVKALKPITYTLKKSWKPTGNGEVYHGFIAHEVDETLSGITGIVCGKKDAMAPELYDAQDEIDGKIPEGKKVMDETGNMTNDMMIQSVDYGKLTPILTAALKEAIAKIETLETKVAALEAG